MVRGRKGGSCWDGEGKEENEEKEEEFRAANETVAKRDNETENERTLCVTCLSVLS